MPVPFNLTSLELAFGREKAAALEEKLIAAYGAEKKVTILELRRSADPDVAALADYVYENVFLHYTMKQWDQSPEEIDPNTTARVPVFLSRDDRYFQDPWQGMPLEGYTPLFKRLLDHPGVTVELGVDARERLTLGEMAWPWTACPLPGRSSIPARWTSSSPAGLGGFPTGRWSSALRIIPWNSGIPRTVNYTVSEGVDPHHGVQVPHRAGQAGVHHDRQGDLPRLHGRAGGDPLLCHHQSGERCPLRPLSGSRR